MKTNPDSPSIFISHASEDSDFGSELALSLKNMGISVWYDQFEIKLGDDVAETISAALAESDIGVIIISKKFFEKQWTKMELYPLLSASLDSSKRILPIWHNISFEEVAKNSPLLASIVPIKSDLGIKKISQLIVSVINDFVKGKTLDQKRFPQKTRVGRRREPLYEAFVSYYELTGKKFAEIIHTVFLDHGIKPFVAHLERRTFSGNFDSKRLTILKKCKYFIFINSMGAFKREEIIKEFQMAYPHGPTHKPKIIIFRHSLRQLPRTNEKFEKKTKFHNMAAIMQHDFENGDELATNAIIVCETELA